MLQVAPTTDVLADLEIELIIHLTTPDVHADIQSGLTNRITES